MCVTVSVSVCHCVYVYTSLCVTMSMSVCHYVCICVSLCLHYVPMLVHIYNASVWIDIINF